VRLLELLVERVGDREGGVESDEIGQCERPHGMCTTDDHPGVDVLRAGKARLQHADRGEQIGDEKRVDDESGAIGEVMTFLFNESVAYCAVRAVVSGLVSNDEINSTRRRTGTGLKKCIR